MNPVKAKLDVVFKKLFTSDDEVLRAFVGDILDIPRGKIKQIKVENPNILPALIDGKQGQMDLKMSVDDRIVNIEIQLCNKGDFIDRSLFYWGRMVGDELKSGEDYIELKKTISVNILDFDLFDWEKPFSSFSIHEDENNALYTDKCAFLCFELKKVNNIIDKNDCKKLWMQLIKAETEEELDMLNNTGVPEIQKAVVILHEMSADEEMREIARLREKAIRDERSAMNFAKREGVKEGIEIGEKRGEKKGIKKGRIEGKEEGLKEGMEKGEKKKQEEIIAKMRNKGYTEEQIKDILS